MQLNSCKCRFKIELYYVSEFWRRHRYRVQTAVTCMFVSLEIEAHIVGHSLGKKEKQIKESCGMECKI